ncbi:MAG: hypothetical protein WBX27_16860 [Specibacter sp.]
MSPKPSFSAVKRVFFTPIDHKKFMELRDNTQQQILRVNPFNIR